MKQVIRIYQTFYVDAIMEIDDNIDPIEKIKNHCERNGGEETVINQGGEIRYALSPKYKYNKELEEELECID